MISVSEAIKNVSQNSDPTKEVETISLSEGFNYTLAENIISPINMPPFRQSAMDGYALHFHDSNAYTITGEVKAGDQNHTILKAGEAVRIFTGAAVPDSANTVVMQEKTIVKNSTLHITDKTSINDNIRPLGEQIFKGQIALEKGAKLKPAAIAYLASLGITNIKVYAKPSIAIVVTGNELADPGHELKYGQVYESNAIMLRSVLKQLGYNTVSIHKVVDVYAKTLETLKKVITTHDVIIISGGISVGDYDFVGKALSELGVDELFYKVKQKPGKPLFFGKKDEKLVFALPGNPAAALSCFYIYVLLAIENISGNTGFSLNRVMASVANNFSKKAERAQFLKAIYHNGDIEILEGQNSSMLHTFALANALVYLPETVTSIKTNDLVEVILLP